MTFTFDGFNWLVRLERGEKLVEKLAYLVKEQQIPGAWISGVGAATKAELGFYDLDSKAYKWETLTQMLEIVSLQGNVAWDREEPVLHIHGTFSDAKMQAFGGHVKELEVGGTCEVLLHRWYKGQLSRSPDLQTGLKFLNV